MKLNSIEDIFSLSIMSNREDIRVSFKKTVNTKQYESEVVEASTTISIDNRVSNEERNLIIQIVEAQLEYSVMYSLMTKSLVTREEFNTRQNDMLTTINSFIEVYENKYGGHFYDMMKTVKLNSEAIKIDSEKS